MDRIFEIRNDRGFNALALEIFYRQSVNNEVYSCFIDQMQIQPRKIRSIKEIPFLPIEFFKHHKVITGKGSGKKPKLFLSSRTTGSVPSRHYVGDVSLYKKSFTKGFEFFYGDAGQYCIIALLPSYLENRNSSLIYMVDNLIRQSRNRNSGYFFPEEKSGYKNLLRKLISLDRAGQPVIVIGVSFALLDFAENVTGPAIAIKNIIFMETGGMKGKRREMVRRELHQRIKKTFSVDEIHSEYGMTELLSQAYSPGNGIFRCPRWMKILIRDPNDPMEILGYEKTGGINVIDLANINSCSFIATRDLGKLHPDQSFEVLGRFDNSDIRGCNLLAGQLIS